MASLFRTAVAAQRTTPLLATATTATATTASVRAALATTSTTTSAGVAALLATTQRRHMSAVAADKLSEKDVSKISSLLDGYIQRQVRRDASLAPSADAVADIGVFGQQALAKIDRIAARVDPLPALPKYATSQEMVLWRKNVYHHEHHGMDPNEPQAPMETFPLPAYPSSKFKVAAWGSSFVFLWGLVPVLLMFTFQADK